ncbi:hypothetical protein TcCL_NonESM01408, partial [Trypanosoma cruzi]
MGHRNDSLLFRLVRQHNIHSPAFVVVAADTSVELAQKNYVVSRKVEFVRYMEAVDVQIAGVLAAVPSAASQRAVTSHQAARRSSAALAEQQVAVARPVALPSRDLWPPDAPPP